MSKTDTKNNNLSVQRIFPYLKKECYADELYIYKTLESTNKTAKEMLIDGARHGTVIIADTQTCGKGRYGRSFFSPPQSGLYISFILYGGVVNLTPMCVTAAAAVAVCDAVLSVCGKDARIKWVNDILLSDKKIGGILTEAVGSPQNNTQKIIVGIGLNLNTKTFPDGLSKTAGSIYQGEMEANIKTRLAAQIINNILSLNGQTDEEKLYCEYKKRLATLGCAITVINSGQAYDALALDIDRQCRLIVQKPDGQILALSSGEISIRII